MSLPSHLAQNQAQGLVAHHPVAQFELGDFDNFVYLLVDWDAHEAAMVDCRAELGPIEKALSTHQIQLKHLWLTHTHWDHVHGLEQLIKKFPHITLHVHPEEMHRLPKNLKNDPRLHPLADHTVLFAGALQAHVIHTPGHSPGECCFFVPTQEGFLCDPVLFSGDTLFIHDCGRTNLPGGSDQQMFESLQRIKKLPHPTIILPGHHYHTSCASTIDVELRESGPLLCSNVAELAGLA